MKGFINILLIIGVAVVSIIGTAFFINYQVEKNTLGTAILTTNLSDTINTFRTNTNANFANLTANLFVSSSTQIVAGTGMSGGGALGTSSASVTLNNAGVLSLGAATGTITLTAPLDMTAKVLSMPVATALQNGYLSSANWSIFNSKITTSSITETITGIDFTSSTTGIFSITSGYEIPTTASTSNWSASRSTLLDASTVDVDQSSSYVSGTLAVATTSIPANTLSSNQIIRGKVHVGSFEVSGGTVTINYQLKYGTTTLVSATSSDLANYGVLEYEIYANGANAQETFLRYINLINPALATTSIGTSVANTALSQNLTLFFNINASAGQGLKFIRSRYYVEKIQ